MLSIVTVILRTRRLMKFKFEDDDEIVSEEMYPPGPNHWNRPE
jgi:hypothetical protein